MVIDRRSCCGKPTTMAHHPDCENANVPKSEMPPLGPGHNHANDGYHADCGWCAHGFTSREIPPKPETQAESERRWGGVERIKTLLNGWRTDPHVAELIQAEFNALADAYRMLNETFEAVNWRTSALERANASLLKRATEAEETLAHKGVCEGYNRTLERERDDLLKRAEAAERERDSLRSFKNSVDDVLNSGDGVYRP